MNDYKISINIKNKIIKLFNSRELGEIITREYATKYFNIGDRSFRIVIAELRKDGFPICSSSSKSGYWLAKNKKEWEMFMNKELKTRIKSLKKEVVAAEKILKDWKG